MHGSRLRASVRSIPQLKSGDLPASAADPSAPMGCRRRRIRLRWGSARKIVLQGLVTTVLPSAVYTSDGMDGPIAPNLASSGRNIGPIHFECISAQHYHLTGVVISPDRANQRAGDLPVQPHFQKYFRSRLTQIKSITRAVSSPMRGVSRSSRTRGGMQWTRQRWARNVMAGRALARERSQRADERRFSRTAKPCGPGTRCWCQVGGGMSARPGAGMPLIRQRR